MARVYEVRLQVGTDRDENVDWVGMVRGTRSSAVSFGKNMNKKLFGGRAGMVVTRKRGLRF